jgi:hypothetical protein
MSWVIAVVEWPGGVPLDPDLNLGLILFVRLPPARSCEGHLVLTQPMPVT